MSYVFRIKINHKSQVQTRLSFPSVNPDRSFLRSSMTDGSMTQLPREPVDWSPLLRSQKDKRGKNEEISLSQNPRPLSPPPISPRRLTRIGGVSGSGSGRSRRWTAAARRGSSRRRRRRSTTARSASGASMPRRGAQPPRTYLAFALSCLFVPPLLLLLLFRF